MMPIKIIAFPRQKRKFQDSPPIKFSALHISIHPQTLKIFVLLFHEAFKISTKKTANNNKKKLQKTKK